MRETGSGSVLLFVFCLLLPAVLEAQPPAMQDAEDPPRIGLVLSGGGARGMAQVGVLQALEEMRVPVHAIAGTSMGAVVGGLYASGQSPADLIELIEHLDWQEVLRDRPQRQSLIFRRKEDERDFQIRLRLGLKKSGVSVPLGLISGQKLSLLLRRETLPVTSVTDFDQLPIPFRAVAADVMTGKAVVLGSGDLPTALRASMSVPAAFVPVEIDGNLLVDGGIANNMPVDVMQGMGVDHIIAVNVSTEEVKREDLNSAVSITGQMISLMIERNVSGQIALLGAQDLLIGLVMEDFSATDFYRGKELVEMGRAATLEHATTLRQWSLSPEAWQAYLDRRAGRLAAVGIDEEPMLRTVALQDDTDLKRDIVTSRLRTQSGKRFSLEELEADLNKIFGLDLFERVDYRLYRVPESHGEEADLFIDVRNKPWGPNFLRFGLNLEDDLEGDTSFAVAARLTATQLNRWGAEWRTDAEVGKTQLLASEFYQPITPNALFVAPRLGYREDDARLALDDETLATFRVGTLAAAVDLGFEIRHCCELRMGLEVSSIDADLKSGNAPRSIDGEELNLVGRFRFDSLDDPGLPTRGGYVDLLWRETLDSRRRFGDQSSREDLESSLLSGRILGAIDHGPHVLLGSLELGTSLADDTLLTPFTLGGFRRLSAYGVGELAGDHLILGTVAYYHRLGRFQSLFNFPIYAGISLEAGNTWLTRDDVSLSDLLYSSTLFVVGATPLGSMHFGWGFGEQGRQNYYLLLGRNF